MRLILAFILNLLLSFAALAQANSSLSLTNAPSIGVQRVVVSGVNFNSANTDTALNVPMPVGITRWLYLRAHISNASASISTATIGLFTATGGGGTAIASNQAITVTATTPDTNNNTMFINPNNANTQAYNDTTIQVRIGTAQGSAATADVILYYLPLS